MELRILVVDDTDTTRHIINAYLSEYDYIIDEAEDAKSALNMIEKNKYEIIITDKNMPGTKIDDFEGGMELLRYVQLNLPSTEIIMMTGYATIETSIEAMKLGAFDYLTKPFTRDEFNDTINRLLEYKTYLNPENTINIYKDFHNEILNFLNNDTGYTDDERHKLLKSIDSKIDLFFKNQKNWEQIILVQREALLNIARYSEQLKEQSTKNGISTELIDKIIDETNKNI